MRNWWGQRELNPHRVLKRHLLDLPAIPPSAWYSRPVPPRNLSVIGRLLSAVELRERGGKVRFLSSPPQGSVLQTDYQSHWLSLPENGAPRLDRTAVTAVPRRCPATGRWGLAESPEFESDTLVGYARLSRPARRACPVVLSFDTTCRSALPSSAKRAVIARLDCDAMAESGDPASQNYWSQPGSSRRWRACPLHSP